MGTLADSLFTVLMSWVRALVSALWALFSSDDMTILEFLGRNWLIIAVVIIAAGLVIDWLIWLIRWQPYHLWAQRARRLLRIEEPEEEAPAAPRARPAVTKKRVPAYEAPAEPEEEPALGEEDEREAYARAGSVPDAALGVYPGMRYARENAEAGAAGSETQRYSLLTEEGPGAAEVARRRDEIDAYRRMQAEAAQRAREEAARREEEARMAREEAARREEEARIAREEAAAQAQAQYERELAEYERQKAQYERELAEYEQQKAAYDAQMTAQETTVIPAVQPSRRRRAALASYSDYAPQEEIGELPDAPAWPQMDAVHSDTMRMTAVKEPQSAAQDSKPGFLDRVAQVIAPQEEDEITGIRGLPPRVDPNEAYMPAKKPRKDGRSRR